jgi:hypothetical protein
MKRGMITLSKNQITELQKNIAQLSQSDPELDSRLTDAQNESTDPINIQVNEDALDMMLDALPPPSAISPDTTKNSNNLRIIISSKLRQLRGVS